MVGSAPTATARTLWSTRVWKTTGLLLAAGILALLAARRYAYDPVEPPPAAAPNASAGPGARPASSGGMRRGGGGKTQERAGRAVAPTKAPRADASHLGQLHRAGSNVLVSTAGLRYGPGSREGNRLQHVLLHARDQPDRPGSHGVFNGGRDAALAVIDRAYQIALQRGPPTRIKRQGRRTVYTVDMGRVIGYVGGRTGARRGHPPARHVRLVLEGKNVITAFPLVP